MRLRLMIAAFAATVMASCVSTFMVTSVSAATLQVTQGAVQINRGQGFEPITGSTTVNPGDIVTVQPGGTAHVIYPDGSIQSVQPGSVAMVGPGSTAPATAAAGSGQQVLTQAVETGPGSGGAVGGGGTVGGGGAAAGGLGGLTGTQLALGAAAIGIGVGAAVYVVQNQNKAASP